jgi:hypothetical protein
LLIVGGTKESHEKLRTAHLRAENQISDSALDETEEINERSATDSAPRYGHVL